MSVSVTSQSVAKEPLLIAHRGASGDRPEHTLAAYELAIEQGADYIEPDLVSTKDLVLIARHENELSGTTDVANREEFEDRRREKMIDGQLVAGWFAEDFTLEEIRTLRAKERVPAARPANTAFNGLYQVPTFEEIVKLVRAKEAETGRRIGLYPELKHPNFMLQDAGIDMVDLLLRDLREADLDDAEDLVFVQSFEVGPLQRLNRRTDVKLIQLIHPQGGPVDEPEMRYAEMTTPSGLAEIAEYADGVGVNISAVLGDDLRATSLVKDARAVGLATHIWTLRVENGMMPAQLQRDDLRASDPGPYQPLWRALIATGADGFFTDNVREFAELTGRKTD
ncbi:MAG: glycerophosphodiester phosphodiesterase family protein [Pseudomonadota bacterium]